MLNAPIRILIVDDHPMVRHGLITFLNAFDDFDLVGEAINGETALELCAKVLPDIILMDLVMPGMDGIAATQAVHEQFPRIKIIALTSFKDEGLIKKALQAGAISYLLKDMSADEIAQAIRTAHFGHATFSPDVADILIQSTIAQPPPGHNLTTQEWAVLALIVEGLNNRQIGERLIVGASTIKFHVSNILAKLGVTSRTEAAALAVRLHLIP